jgi:hypothetical protein
MQRLFGNAVVQYSGNEPLTSKPGVSGVLATHLFDMRTFCLQAQWEAGMLLMLLRQLKPPFTSHRVDEV